MAVTAKRGRPAKASPSLRPTVDLHREPEPVPDTVTQIVEHTPSPIEVPAFSHGTVTRNTSLPIRRQLVNLHEGQRIQADRQMREMIDTLPNVVTWD